MTSVRCVSTEDESRPSFASRVTHLRRQYEIYFKKVCGSAAPYESLTAWFLFQFCESSWSSAQKYRIEQLPIRGRSPLLRYLRYTMCRAVDVNDAANAIDSFLVEIWNESEKGLFSNKTKLPRTLTDLQTIFDVSANLLDRLHARYIGLDFESDLVYMFVNYDSLFGFSRGEGRGWQLSIPPSFHALLVSEFSVTCEAFASPVNTQSVSFYSLFSEDICFGSLGNFFAARSTPTVMEVNPPFEPLIMDRTVTKLEEQLLNDKHLFVVILPIWGPIERVESSAFFQESIHLEKGHHEFTNGWPYHAPVSGPRPVWNDSASVICILSNMNFTLTDDLIERLKNSWIA